MYLEELIGNVQLENDKFECKSRLNREDVVGWLKSIAGFANALGGEFYIGVEDKTNKLIGFSRTEADNERNYFNNQVNEHLSPRPQMKISFLSYEVKGNERFAIRVNIPESVVKPVILKYKNIPSIFIFVLSSKSISSTLVSPFYFFYFFCIYINIFCSIFWGLSTIC